MATLAAVAYLAAAGVGSGADSFVAARGLPGRSSRHLAARAAGAAGGAAKQVEDVVIEMPAPLDGRIGVSVQGGRRTVSRLSHEDAYDLGWRVGDVILEVGGAATDDNEAVRAAVASALAAHAAEGKPLCFRVRRAVKEVDTTQGMLRMTPGAGGALTMSMTELTRGLTREFSMVAFLDGTTKVPGNNLSARLAEALLALGLAYKAVDCGDEKYNPGVRAAVEELTGEYALPQLFAGGRLLGNGHALAALFEAGKLKETLLAAGAVPASSTSST